jgi:hypothetical protein
MKVGLVAAGYVGAFLGASAIVATHVAATSGPDRQASSGMYAFGDALLFLGVFGVFAIPPSGAGLFFLRPYRSFWIALSVAGALVATSGLAAVINCVAAQTADAGSFLHHWSGYAVLRILAAPLVALAFFLAGVLAPSRSSRIALCAAALVDAAVFVSVALMWFQSSWSH